jgi:hypothetical protein
MVRPMVVYWRRLHTQAPLNVGARGGHGPLSMPLWSRPMVIIGLPAYQHEAEGSHHDLRIWGV